MSQKRLVDELEAARGELSHAEKSAADAHHEYRQYVAAGDLLMAANAKRAIANAERSRDMLADRVEALEAAVAEAEQASADQRLKQVQKRAKTAAEAERQAGFELGHIHEQISVLHDKLKAATAEAGSASVRVRQAAEAAGRPVPKSPRSSLKREANVDRMIEAVRRLGRLLDQQERSAAQASATARKAS